MQELELVQNEIGDVRLAGLLEVAIPVVCVGLQGSQRRESNRGEFEQCGAPAVLPCTATAV